LLNRERIWRAAFQLRWEGFPGPVEGDRGAGQRIGDHSVSHPYFTKLTDAQIRDQVLGAGKARSPRRPASTLRRGSASRTGTTIEHAISAANGTGLVPVGWTVDTPGWKGTSGGITTQTVVSRVLGGLRPGEIVLMHCGSNPDDHSTPDANALSG
jgi:peptidoglycan/xylan/chitin deacetylase (PgdA/CDA1 family)